jgi:hypothetical protein
VVIDALRDSVTDKDTHLEISTVAIPLKAGKMVPIVVQYYETTGIAMVALYWKSASQDKEIIPSTALYYKKQEEPITGYLYMVDFIDVPMAATDLAQDVPATYAHTSLSLVWKAPRDFGCLTIQSYQFQRWD